MLAETLAAYLAEETCDAAAAVQKALFMTLSEITSTADLSIFKFSGRCVVFRLINAARTSHQQHEGIEPWLIATAQKSESILLSEELISPRQSGVLVNSAKSMLSEMKRNGIDVPNTPATDMGMVATPKNCIQLLTMHGSKGHEFDAVAVVSLHDNKVPFFGCSNDDERNEYRRLLYVATTRARKLLMYFTDESNALNVPSRFLGMSGLQMI